MDTKSKYITTAVLSLIVGAMAMLGVDVVDNDEGYLPYTCDKEGIDDIMAYKLSRVNDAGIQRNAYYDRDRSRKYKVCSTGWYRLINIDDYMPEIDTITCKPTMIVAITDVGTLWCDGVGGNCVDDSLNKVEIEGLC